MGGTGRTGAGGLGRSGPESAARTGMGGAFECPPTLSTSVGSCATAGAADGRRACS